MDEGNATILALFVCLLTVLYLRDRQGQQHAVAMVHLQQDRQPDDWYKAANRNSLTGPCSAYGKV